MIPDDAAIHRLTTGDLSALRQRLLALTNVAPRYLLGRAEVLAETLALAAIARAKIAHDATLPPEQPWMREAAGLPPEPTETAPNGLDLSDPIVLDRMRELVGVNLSDDLIWIILQTEFEERNAEIQTEGDP